MATKLKQRTRRTLNDTQRMVDLNGGSRSAREVTTTMTMTMTMTRMMTMMTMTTTVLPKQSKERTLPRPKRDESRKRRREPNERPRRRLRRKSKPAKRRSYRSKAYRMQCKIAFMSSGTLCHTRSQIPLPCRWTQRPFQSTIRQCGSRFLCQMCGAISYLEVIMETYQVSTETSQWCSTMQLASTVRTVVWSKLPIDAPPSLNVSSSKSL